MAIFHFVFGAIDDSGMSKRAHSLAILTADGVLESSSARLLLDMPGIEPSGMQRA